MSTPENLHDAIPEHWKTSHKLEPPTWSSQIMANLNYLDSFTFLGYSIVKIGLSIVIALVGGYVLFGQFIVTDDGSEATSLVDQLAAQKAKEFSKNLVGGILSDPNTQKEITSFFHRVGNDDQLQTAISEAASALMENQDIRRATSDYLKGSLSKFYQDEESVTKTAEFVTWVIEKQMTKQATAELLSWSLDQKPVQDSAARVVVNLCHEDWVKDHMSGLLKFSSMEVLKDEEVRDQAKDFVQTVLKDKNVHVDAGNALWATVKNSLTPSYFK